jgi:hypothetical protein
MYPALDPAPDPALDPALFISDLQDANKKLFLFFKFLFLFLFEYTITSFFKDKNSLRNHETV